MTLTADRFSTYCTNPAAFRDDLIVEADGALVPFGPRMDPWQRADFLAMDPAWLACVGRGPVVKRNRGFLERGRGASKTTDQAISSEWSLFCASRPIRGFAVAADRDQAGLLHEAIERDCRNNPLLKKTLKVERDAVVNVGVKHPGAGSRLSVISADVASSYGLIPDFVIADELTVWPGDSELWDSLFSACVKKRRAVVQIITNAGCGMGVSWQWRVRETARTDPDKWVFSRLDTAPSWQNQEQIDEQRRMLPKAAFARLFLNQWLSEFGDAFEAAEIERLVTLAGPETKPRTGVSYVGSFDLGVKRDWTGLVVWAVDHQRSKISLAHSRVWKPRPGVPVSLNDVQNEIVRLDQLFNCRAWMFDPSQGYLLSENLRRELHNHQKIQEFFPSGRNLNKMATAAIESVKSQLVEIYRDPILIDDLLRLQLEEGVGGWKLVTSRSSDGSHGDLGTAALIGLIESLSRLKFGYPSNPYPGDRMDHHVAPNRGMPSGVVDEAESIFRKGVPHSGSHRGSSNGWTRRPDLRETFMN
jgi:hypothetical protein